MNRSDDLFPPPGGTPDPYWQGAFANVTDTPPLRVWEGVERQLDLDEADGILPLWQHRQGRQSMLFGRWAAGIVASLMLTALGWWAWHREDALRPDRAVAVAPKFPKTAASGTLLPVNPVVPCAEAKATKIDTYPTLRLADASPATRRWARSGVFSGTFKQPGAADSGTASGSTLAVIEKPVEPETGQVVASVADVETNRLPGVNGTLVFTETSTSIRTLMKEPQPFRSGVAGLQPLAMSRSTVTRSTTIQSFSNHSFNSQLLDGQSSDRQSTSVQSPIGQFPPALFLGNRLAVEPALVHSERAIADEVLPQQNRADASLATKPLATIEPGNSLFTEKKAAQPALASSKKRRRPWLSAGVTASTFSPAVAVRSVFSPVMSVVQLPVSGLVNTGPTSTANVQSGVGRSVAYQAGVGIPLGERWSVETGVGYLTGRNDINSPARISSSMSAVNSGAIDNLYTDLLTRSVGQPVMANGFADSRLYDKTVANQATDYISAQQQVVSNSYEFLQVPVQVGYELRPRHKFGLVLLTGLVSNWFVRNTVAETITVKPGDGVYRPVTMAGTAGMRLRYRPDNSWSASVAGTFQHSLQSLTKSDVGLQVNPQQIGLSFSVDRHF